MRSVLIAQAKRLVSGYLAADPPSPTWRNVPDGGVGSIPCCVPTSPQQESRCLVLIAHADPIPELTSTYLPFGTLLGRPKHTIVWLDRIAQRSPPALTSVKSCSVPKGWAGNPPASPQQSIDPFARKAHTRGANPLSDSLPDSAPADSGRKTLWMVVLGIAGLHQPLLRAQLQQIGRRRRSRGAKAQRRSVPGFPR